MTDKPETLSTGRLKAAGSAYMPHARVAKTFSLPSRAKQSFKDECDINTIMAKYAQTGLVAHTTKHRGQYGDVTAALELQESIAVVENAMETFDSLPSAIRKRFSNDPTEFLQFVTNPVNQDAINEMGLGRPSEPAESVPAQPAVVSPADPPAAPAA